MVCFRNMCNVRKIINFLENARHMRDFLCRMAKITNPKITEKTECCRFSIIDLSEKVTCLKTSSGASGFAKRVVPNQSSLLFEIVRDILWIYLLQLAGALCQQSLIVMVREERCWHNI